MTYEKAFSFSNNFDATEFATYITEHRQEIYDEWCAAIRARSTRGGAQILNILEEEYRDKSDLLSIIVLTLTGQVHAEIARLHGLVEKVRTTDYSVSELFYEVFSLQDAFESAFTRFGTPGDGDIVTALRMTRSVLGRFFSAVLEQTSWIYEHVTESGRSGFCQMDKNGRITYCNPEMKKIFGGKNIVGERMDKLFAGVHREFITNVTTSHKVLSPGSRELEIVLADGVVKTVWADIEAILFEEEHICSYAMLTDISQIAERETEIFNSSPWCVVKTDTLGKIQYANDAARSMFNIDDYRDRNVMEFVIDDHREKMEGALRSRQRNISSDYRLMICPEGEERRPIEVDVCGIPVTDAGGYPVGSIGIFHDRMTENASEKINAAMVEDVDTMTMLKNVASIVHEVIPFDICIVSRYSKKTRDGHVHANPFFQYSPQHGQIGWDKKWTELSAPKLRWMQRRKIESYNLESFLQYDEMKDLAEDTDVIQLREKGVKYFMFRVAGDERIPLATFSLMMMDEGGFDDHACKMMEELPLEKVMLMALYKMEVDEIDFRYELVRKIARSEGIEEAANLFVDGLRTEYDWLHVSLFRVDQINNLLHLQSQAGVGEMALPNGYSQSLEEGFLGECYATGDALINSDIDSESAYKAGLDHDGKEVHAKSELCAPIKTGENIRWMLNIEADKRNAFSSSEKQSVIQACEEFAVMIERLTRSFSFQACFTSTTDPVIITDSENNIVESNGSANQILGIDPDTNLSGYLGDYFEDERQAELQMKASRSVPTEVVLKKHGSGEDVNMLMSCSVLPKEFGQKVYISKDLTKLRRMEELAYLSDLTYEVAAQTQSALTLAFTWLRRLKNGSVPPEEAPQLIDKVMRQLNKVQATHDRMALNDESTIMELEAPIQLNIIAQTRGLLDGFPESDAALVEIPREDAVPDIYADPAGIDFIVESLLSYFLRYASREKKIKVGVTQQKNALEFSIEGVVPTGEKHDGVREAFMERLRRDIAISRKRIEQVVEVFNGKVRDAELHDGHVRFVIEFPVHVLEGVA